MGRRGGVWSPCPRWCAGVPSWSALALALTREGKQGIVGTMQTDDVEARVLAWPTWARAYSDAGETQEQGLEGRRFVMAWLSS